MEKGINTEKDFEIAKKIAHVLSGDCSEENRSSLDVGVGRQPESL